jgi:small subunit ribosomal protein S17
MTTESKKATLTGVIEKVSSSQTVRVAVHVSKTHPIYRKRYTQVKHVLAHDADSKYQVGDKVLLETCRPVSKLKHWIVVKKLTD